MKATGIVRRTLPIREGAPSCTTVTSVDCFIRGMVNFARGVTGE